MKATVLLWHVTLGCFLSCGAVEPLIFPPPRQIKNDAARFPLTEAVPILLPLRPSAEDRFLARFLTTELSDHYGLALRTEQVDALPENRPFLLLGAKTNPLVQLYCRRHGSPPSESEGYRLEVTRSVVVVAGSDEPGAFYGLQSLRQLLVRTPQGVQIQGVSVQDWPLMPFRGIKLYLPGSENIGYFKRFVRNVMALYKYNTLIMEMNAGMRFDRHPELNAGWIELGKDLNYTRRDRSLGPGRQFQDSANADTADGGVLEKDEVAELVRFARQHHIEVIPEIPSLTHSYYLLTRHRELAEIQAAEWPDTYCPSEPKTYDLLFDVLDEYVDVMRPHTVHIGHDEWRTPVGVCQRCKGKDPTELFAADLNRIYAHLRATGIQTAIWGDHLVEPLRGVKTQHVRNPRGTPYDTPGGLSPDQVRRLIPKDILIFNWFWDNAEAEGLHNGLGEPNEVALSEWGFRQVFGNFQPHMRDFDRRAARRGILGGAPSSWAATNELNFGKDLMIDFLGCANLLWSSERPDMDRLALIVQERLPGTRGSLSTRSLPSADDPMQPIPLNPGGAVEINADASSLIFVHACRKRARNRAAFYSTWNFADAAELLGWYEVAYVDGYVETVPLRYGWNILEQDWPAAHAPKSVAYEARLEQGSDGRARFAYEWINPRFGKPIREVRLHVISEENPVNLEGLRVVLKRSLH